MIGGSDCFRDHMLKSFSQARQTRSSIDELHFPMICAINNLMKRTNLYGETPEQALQGVINVLNAGPRKHRVDPYGDAHQNLVQLIRAWQAAKGARHAFEEEEGLVGAVPGLLKMKYPLGCPNLGEMGNACQVILAPIHGLGSYGIIVYAPKRRWTAWDLACQQFIRLITNPACERIGGPCPRCGQYYRRAGKKVKRFCSRQCASLSAAQQSTKKKREQEHAHKIQLAMQAKVEWEVKWNKGRTKKGWKEFVRDTHPDITPKFLTRAVNKGELSEPAIEKN